MDTFLLGYFLVLLTTGVIRLNKLLSAEAKVLKAELCQKQDQRLTDLVYEAIFASFQICRNTPINDTNKATINSHKKEIAVSYVLTRLQQDYKKLDYDSLEAIIKNKIEATLPQIKKSFNQTSYDSRDRV